ncbi:hypothetical protein DPX16_23440 [Anabarilius grahami]|uniref:Uncharacterized protein n=1 Tax=Anabarilius grahami TaxID=495550 RepID=A0A3N0YS15_ANAGA|nr:hypothetical protein DPX16_23440 [Anabarilius grahami]
MAILLVPVPPKSHQQKPHVSAEDRLRTLRQDGRPLERYVEEFSELSYLLNWPDAPLNGCFLMGLDKDMIRYSQPACFFSLVESLNLIIFLNGSEFKIEEIQKIADHPLPVPSEKHAAWSVQQPPVSSTYPSSGYSPVVLPGSKSNPSKKRATARPRRPKRMAVASLEPQIKSAVQPEPSPKEAEWLIDFWAGPAAPAFHEPPKEAELLGTLPEPAVPAFPKPALILLEPDPILHGPAPASHEPALILLEPDPILQGPAPALPEPAPALHEPAPALHEPAPALHEPAPALHKPDELPTSQLQQPTSPLRPSSPLQPSTSQLQPSNMSQPTNTFLYDNENFQAPVPNRAKANKQENNRQSTLSWKTETNVDMFPQTLRFLPTHETGPQQSSAVSYVSHSGVSQKAAPKRTSSDHVPVPVAELTSDGRNVVTVGHRSCVHCKAVRARPSRTPLDHAPPSRSFSGPPTSSSETNSQVLSSNLPAERKKPTNCTSAKLKLDTQHQCK